MKSQDIGLLLKLVALQKEEADASRFVGARSEGEGVWHFVAIFFAVRARSYGGLEH